MAPGFNLEVHGYGRRYENIGRRLNVGHTPNSLLWVVSEVANKTVIKKTRICAEMQGLTYHPLRRIEPKLVVAEFVLGSIRYF